MSISGTLATEIGTLHTRVDACTLRIEALRYQYASWKGRDTLAARETLAQLLRIEAQRDAYADRADELRDALRACEDVDVATVARLGFARWLVAHGILGG